MDMIVTSSESSLVAPEVYLDFVWQIGLRASHPMNETKLSPEKVDK